MSRAHNLFTHYYSSRMIPSPRLLRSLAGARGGTTVTECVIAGTLLAAALMTMGLVHQRMVDGVTRVRMLDTIRTALANARAEIGNWPTSEITVERIRSLPVPPQLQNAMQSLEWSAQIDDWQSSEETVAARRVILGLQWQEPSAANSVRQQSLTFWVQP